MNATFTLKDKKVRENCLAHIRAIPEWLVYDVVIRKPQKSRAQENYWHTLLGILADYNGDDIEDIKLRVKYACLPLHEVVVGEKTYMAPPSTTKLTKEDYSKLIEATLRVFDSLELKAPTASYYGMEAA